MSTVSEGYYSKDETNNMVSSVSTELHQTANSIDIRFNEISKDINGVESGADARFEEISKYIRFVDGNIILGEASNNLTLKIENDKITFFEGVNEVAYFSNRKLYVTDGEYINSLKLGKFTFIPRENGNLSFKKVVD